MGKHMVSFTNTTLVGAQWLSGRVLDSRLKVRGANFTNTTLMDKYINKFYKNHTCGKVSGQFYKHHTYGQAYGQFYKHDTYGQVYGQFNKHHLYEQVHVFGQFYKYHTYGQASGSVL